MSAVHAGASPSIDRRTVLRAAGTLAAVGAVSSAAAATPSLRSLFSTPAATAVTAATWEQAIGHTVELRLDSGPRYRAQLVDVRPLRPDPALTGEAYSLLFAAPSLPDASANNVRVSGQTAPSTSLTILPVNGDGSWEALVDTRRPTIHARRH